MLRTVTTRTTVTITSVSFVLLFSVFASSLAMAGSRTPAPPEAKAYIISPTDGVEVTSPVVVRFGLSGMGVAPAGTEKAMTGHHHLLIDSDLPDLDKPIPSDEYHRHFGGGQTEVTIDLAPGQHSLQILLGDLAHVPHDPPVYSNKILVIVIEK